MDKKYIVGKGRSLVTARRGVAHAGAVVTLRDITGDDPEATLAALVESGKLVPVEAEAPAPAAEGDNKKGAKRAKTDEAPAAGAPAAEGDNKKGAKRAKK